MSASSVQCESVRPNRLGLGAVIPAIALFLLLLARPAFSQEHQHEQKDPSEHSEHSEHSQPKDAAERDGRTPQAEHGDHQDLDTRAAEATAEQQDVIMPDDVFGAEEMAHARLHLRKHNGGQTNWMFMADRFEYREHDEEEIALLDAQGWVGGDLHKLWFKTEAEFILREDGSEEGDEFEELEVQALYSRSISPYFDLNLGLRHDFEPGPERTFAVVGVQGLAPYWFEVDAELFLSDDGDVEARFEAEYEMLFTQRLVGQFRSEVALSAQDIPELGIGSGLSTAELGFRLRYEIVREFAPYVGYEWVREFGSTADFTRGQGKDPETTAIVAGFRIWY